MHEFTARLPLLSRDWAGVEALPEPQFIGSSTSHAIWNGGVLGIVWELQGFIRQSRKQFKSLRVILTGGDADFFAKKLKTSLFLHPHLVLTGLNKILSYNVKKTEVG
jgi:type III pantothenate kinase